MFPVDLPGTTSTCQDATPHHWEELQPAEQPKALSNTSVCSVQLFGDAASDCPLLYLHPPEDPTKVVALFLHGSWWSLADVLRTTSSSRAGLLLVSSLVERVVLFVLSQMDEGSCTSQGVAMFAPPPCDELAKLMWCDGEAVGFYTVKQKGRLYGDCSVQCFLFPVLDTLMVRRGWRRRGLGLQMLEDYCSSFADEELLGISSPLSAAMAAVCRKFLQHHEAQRERLYEVEPPGGWAQRRNIWLGLQLGRYAHSHT